MRIAASGVAGTVVLLVVSLAAWEARRGRDLPALSGVVTAAGWLTFVVDDERTGYGPFAAYLVWAIPLAAGLALTLLRPAAQRRRAPVARVAAPAHA